MVNDLNKEQTNRVTNLNCMHLKCNNWYRSIEQTYHIQETAGNILSHQHGTVFILRVTPLFDIPILNCPNYVAFVGRT